MFVRITATVVVLSVIRGRLGRGSWGNLLLWLGLLVLNRWAHFARGWLYSRRRRWSRRYRSRSSTRPRWDKMRSSRLSNIVTSIGNDFTDLLDLLPLDIPNDTYTTAFLLLWFILSLLRRTTDRR